MSQYLVLWRVQTITYHIFHNQVDSLFDFIMRQHISACLCIGLLEASICHARLFEVAKDNLIHLSSSQIPLGPLVKLGGPSVSPTDYDDYGWTNGNNNSDEYHAYHFKELAGGRGISVVTSPDRIRHFEAATVPSDANDMSSPPYEERHIPGKGRGLVATRMLYKGDKILLNTPILMVDSSGYDSLGGPWTSLPRLAVENLPPETEKLFFSMHGASDTDDVRGRIDVNAYDVRIGGHQYFAVLPEIARINHDCRPNTNYYFDENTLTQMVVASRDIAPGTELSVTYINPVQEREHRNDNLLATWGFNCSCSVCRLPPHLSRRSDERVEDIARLQAEYELVDEGEWMGYPPQKAEALISLLEEEGIRTNIGNAYLYAAFTHCAHGNYWETVRHANTALDWISLSDGADDARLDSLREMTRTPDEEACWKSRTESRQGGGGGDGENVLEP
ncbi:lysine methyltransferase [Metarhizium rileyi]|uniref:Lysine methyltransferase n=1 Tax=Metarhizium rileyi (strain RCEF 4871) TaxID=1649241 RepID=A0A162JDF3_METRR|nr:lysine methyltransferase [Metarhizium rileyi RCEF 4871]TWU76201.1 hypothetical protein ED733_003663 [Metarhizium rileyi]